MAEPITLRAAAKKRIWALVERRRGHSTKGVFAAYLGHARKLPHWLRHNGLALTLDYLRFLSAERKDDDTQVGALALLADWGAELGTREGLHLTKVLDPDANPVPDGDASAAVARKRLVDRLARREAELFKRYAEALDPDKKCTTIEPQPDMKIADQPPPWQVAAPRLRSNHPGLCWRYDGEIKSDKLFRKTHIDALLTNGANGNFQTAFAHYLTSYTRRKHWIECRAATREVALRSRLFIDLGNRGVFETQCSMHPITGMPVIAASAQKSLLRRYIDRKISNMPEALQQPMRDWIADHLGTPEVDGRLCVHDAWWVPGSADVPWMFRGWVTSTPCITRATTVGSGTMHRPPTVPSPIPRSASSAVFYWLSATPPRMSNRPGISYAGWPKPWTKSA